MPIEARVETRYLAQAMFATGFVDNSAFGMGAGCSSSAAFRETGARCGPFKGRYLWRSCRASYDGHVPATGSKAEEHKPPAITQRYPEERS